MVTREENIDNIMDEYHSVYDKLLKHLDEYEMDLVDRILDLERQLTLLEE